MDTAEKALRLGCLENNWVAFGRTDISPETLRLQGNLTKRIPIEIFRAACERACLLTAGGFPPGPGDILEAARAIAPGDQAMLTSPKDLRSTAIPSRDRQL